MTLFKMSLLHDLNIISFEVLFFLIQCAPLECVFTRMENSCMGTLSRWPPSAFTFFLRDLKTLGVQNKYSEKHVIISLTLQTLIWMSPGLCYFPKHFHFSLLFMVGEDGQGCSAKYRDSWVCIYLYTVTNGVCPSLPFLTLSHDCPLGDSNDTAHPLG